MSKAMGTLGNHIKQFGQTETYYWFLSKNDRFSFIEEFIKSFNVEIIFQEILILTHKMSSLMIYSLSSWKERSWIE